MTVDELKAQLKQLFPSQRARLLHKLGLLTDDQMRILIPPVKRSAI